MTSHQQKQVEIINQIEEQVKNKTVQFSTVSPIEDFANDVRMCLSGVHFPKLELLAEVEKIINQLKKIEPSYYYYPNPNLHITIKSVRVINNPPTFTSEDISKAANVFSEVIPKHKAYRAYFYRLMLFHDSLSLMATTDPWFDEIILDLDTKLKTAGVPDDKKYFNTQYFFNNITLARFSNASETFAQKVSEISSSLSIDPYVVDCVSLVAGNSVFSNRLTVHSWDFK